MKREPRRLLKRFLEGKVNRMQYERLLSENKENEMSP